MTFAQYFTVYITDKCLFCSLLYLKTHLFKHFQTFQTSCRFHDHDSQLWSIFHRFILGKKNLPVLQILPTADFFPTTGLIHSMT